MTHTPTRPLPLPVALACYAVATLAVVATVWLALAVVATVWLALGIIATFAR